MTGERRIIGPLAGIALLFCGGCATAQEDLDLGKSPAQLFASDCAICHKTPRGLSKAGGVFGVESFLREHYTASRQSAAVLAAYLRAVDTEPAPAQRRRAAPARKPAPKPADEKKPADTKPADKPAQDKPSQDKPASDKATQARVFLPAAVMAN